MKHVRMIISIISILIAFSHIVVNSFNSLFDPESMSIVYLLLIAVLIIVTKIPKSWREF